MNLRLITAPTTEPVSLETAKLFLRVDGAAEDALITSFITAAREKGEELARRAFITQIWELILDCWPSDYCVRLYRPPLLSVTTVKYVDRNNTESTWTDYVTDVRNEPGVIVFRSVPTVTLKESGAIAVRYVAGYGAAASDVPERIKNTILALVAQWYEMRMIGDVPKGIKDAFVGERVVWF